MNATDEKHKPRKNKVFSRLVTSFFFENSHKRNPLTGRYGVSPLEGVGENKRCLSRAKAAFS